VIKRPGEVFNGSVISVKSSTVNIDMEFEMIEVSGFEAEVKAEAAQLIETAQLITGKLETALEATTEAISRTFDQLSMADTSDYRSRLRNQVIKSAIELVCCSDTDDVVIKADPIAQSCSAQSGKCPQCGFGRDSWAEDSGCAEDLLLKFNYLPRIAFVLRHMLGCSIAEASFLLGLEQPSFISNLHQAYLELGAGSCLENPQAILVLTQSHWTSPARV
jgi:hypothetical protein